MTPDIAAALALASEALAAPDPDGCCTKCYVPMMLEDREPTPLCALCVQDVAASLAAHIRSLAAALEESRQEAALAEGLPKDFSSQAARLRHSKRTLAAERDRLAAEVERLTLMWARLGSDLEAKAMGIMTYCEERDAAIARAERAEADLIGWNEQCSTNEYTIQRLYKERDAAIARAEEAKDRLLGMTGERDAERQISKHWEELHDAASTERDAIKAEHDILQKQNRELAECANFANHARRNSEQELERLRATLSPAPGTRCTRCHHEAPNLEGCALCNVPRLTERLRGALADRQLLIEAILDFSHHHAMEVARQLRGAER